MAESSHKLHIYTGNGKGKTTSAVGLAIRGVGAGNQVAFLQFDKGYEGGEDFYSERNILRKLDGLYLFASGLRRFDEEDGFRFGVTDGDKIEAKVGLEKAEQMITSGKFDLVILDEAITSANFGLFEKEDIHKLINTWIESGKLCELVLTGRGAWPELIEMADLVSEIKKVKHYFDDGLKARKGVEY